MNLIPWNRDLDVDAEVNIASAVYNDIPLEKSICISTQTKNIWTLRSFRLTILPAPACL